MKTDYFTSEEPEMKKPTQWVSLPSDRSGAIANDL